MTAMDQGRIARLKGEIEQKERRIVELRQELDEARDLIRRMEEHAEDYTNVIEQWKETFDMIDAGEGWTWGPFWDGHNQIIDDYHDLVRRWNRVLPLWSQNPVGRPLAASEAQCAQVRKLHKAGKSLRWIAEETNLGLGTVRTILDKADGADRTMNRYRERLNIAPVLRQWKRQKRVGNRLPQRAHAVVEEGRKLIKEAKGLGR